MKPLRFACLAIAMAATWPMLAAAGDPTTTGDAAQNAPDNTGRNQRDRGDTLTSGDQSETEADRTITQKIRQAVVADDSLSITAHNVKIITVNGVVTLRGPVNTDQERKTIASIAGEVAGADKVQNHLEVASAK
jgi:osmotically-inducible protein OsmY